MQNRGVQHNQLPSNQPPNPSQTHKKAPNKAPRSSQIVVMGPPSSLQTPIKPSCGYGGSSSQKPGVCLWVYGAKAPFGSSQVWVMGGPAPCNLECVCGCVLQRPLWVKLCCGYGGATPCNLRCACGCVVQKPTWVKPSRATTTTATTTTATAHTQGKGKTHRSKQQQQQQAKSNTDSPKHN